MPDLAGGARGMTQEGKKKKKSSTYLNSGFQCQEGVAGVAHLEDASESILCQVANLQDFQIGRHGAEVELADENIIDDDGRLGGFV